MASSYDNIADMMLTTMAGEFSGLNRDEMVSLLKAKFPDETMLRSYTDSLQAHIEQQIDQLQARLQHGQTMAFAYPVHPVLAPGAAPVAAQQGRED